MLHRRHLCYGLCSKAMSAEKPTRINEWFVPKFGPTRFRVFVGLLFLPYTGMCVSFAIIGSMLASEIAWDRVGAIALIYTLALGISAHVADSLGSKKTKPWGIYFTKAQMFTIMIATLTAPLCNRTPLHCIFCSTPSSHCSTRRVLFVCVQL